MWAALNRTLQRKALGSILNLVPLTENIVKLTSLSMECFREAAYTQEAGPGERVGSDWWSTHLPLRVAAHAALSSPRSNLMGQTANRTTLLGQLGGAQLSGSSFPFTKSYSTILSFERTWGLLAPTPVRLPESRGLTGTAVSKGYCALDRQIYLSQPFVTLVVLASPSW